MKNIDIVEDIFLRVKNILGNDCNLEIRSKLEDEEYKVREDWGGTEPYILKKNKERAKQRAIEALKNGATVKQVVSDTGISRTQVYMLLKRNN